MEICMMGFTLRDRVSNEEISRGTVVMDAVERMTALMESMELDRSCQGNTKRLDGLKKY